MSRKTIPVEESFYAWLADPEYVKAYNELEDEFSSGTPERALRKRGCFIDRLVNQQTPAAYP